MREQNGLVFLGVNELYHERNMQHTHHVLPALCLFEFTDEMQSLITEKQELLVEHDIAEVVVRTTLAKWYFQLTNRYHHEVLTYLHIRIDSISFSGKMKPYKAPHFSTPATLINSINKSGNEIKALPLDKLTIPLALGLIKEIQTLSTEYYDLSDLYWELDEVSSNIRKLDEKVVNKLSFECDDVLSQVSNESNSLSSRQEVLEIQIENLLTRLVKNILGIKKGDWISYVAPVTVEMTQLRFDNCIFCEGILTIYGLGLTKAGILGKREQSIRIELVPEK
jgi:hypothetical protein